LKVKSNANATLVGENFLKSREEGSMQRGQGGEGGVEEGTGTKVKQAKVLFILEEEAKKRNRKNTRV